MISFDKFWYIRFFISNGLISGTFSVSTKLGILSTDKVLQRHFLCHFFFFIFDLMQVPESETLDFPCYQVPFLPCGIKKFTKKIEDFPFNLNYVFCVCVHCRFIRLS